MAGTVYVLAAHRRVLDENAIVAMSDLGRAGDSWNRASLSHIDGRIFAHTIKEVICTGQSN